MDIKPFLLIGGVSLILNNITPIPPQPNLIPGSVTVYCDEGTTATGTTTRKGVCAYSEEYLGATIILYQRLPDGSVGDILGYYDVEDTGSNPGINNGSVVDIWKPEDEMMEFINLTYENDCHGRVYIQIIPEVSG